jgi:release factor glutamine methyltransferase
MAVRPLMNEAVQRLGAAGIATARLDAEVLLAHCLGISRLALLTETEEDPSTQQRQHYEQLIARRMEHEPVAYIIGRAEFWSLDLTLTADVLIPRPDSELLVSVALKHLGAGASGTLMDLGTGSGCLSLALLMECPRLAAIGLDVSAGALDVARENAQRLGLMRRFELRSQSMLEWLNGAEKVDMIVSNPPYVTPQAFAGLAKDVRLYEPKGALLGGADGLDFYRAIAGNAAAHLRPGGAVVVEIGYDQGEAVASLFDQHFRQVDCLQDLAGHNRVVYAREYG